MLTPSEDLRAIIAIIRERNRQIAEEDWTPEHDDTHTRGELAAAAACYAIWDTWANTHGCFPRTPGRILYQDSALPCAWPWGVSWWKPKDQKRNLERAGALIVAELARIYREEESNA